MREIDGVAQADGVLSLLWKQSEVRVLFLVSSVLVWTAAYNFCVQEGFLVAALLFLCVALIVGCLALRKSGRINASLSQCGVWRWVWLVLPTLCVVYVLSSTVCSKWERERCWMPLAFFLAIVCAVVMASALRQGRFSRLSTELMRQAGRRWILWLALAVHLVGAVCLLQMHAGDKIDVFTFHKDGVEALLHGVDPYTISHKNIYSAEEVARFYAPGIVWGGRVHQGYPYPPINLLFVFPGYLLGDIRYSHVIAVLITALLMAGTGRGRFGNLLVCALLLNPLTFWVEMNSWIEPFVLVSLAAVLYAAGRKPRWLPVALGVFLVSKQFVVAAIPFLFFFFQKDWRRNLSLSVKTILVGSLLTLPVVLWNLYAFYQSTVLLMAHVPPRTDSLSFVGLMPLPHFVLPLMLLGTVLFCLRYAMRTPSGFVGSFAVVLLGWMMVNHLAFINYYFLISQAFCLAAVAMTTTADGRGQSELAGNQVGNVVASEVSVADR